MKSDSGSNKMAALVVATGGSFLTPLMGSSMNIALPSIGQEFSMDAVLLSWVTTSYILATAVVLIPFGRLADIYGRKRIFTYGIWIYIVANILAAISPSGVVLISCRVLLGIGGAMIFGTGVAILTSVFPAGERGRVLGINIGAIYLGLSIGPFVGGFLTQHFGWRSIFLVNVPLGLIVAGAVLWKLKGEWAEAKGEKLDINGGIIYGLAIVALIYGLSLLPAIRGILLVAMGILGFSAFVKWEMRVKYPVLDIGLFRHNRLFALSNLAALFNYSGAFAAAFLLSLYLQYVKGLNPQDAGLILVCMPAVQCILAPLVGRLSDRIEPRIISSAGLALTSSALFSLSLLTETTTLRFIIPSLMLLGSGIALFASPNQNAIMSSVSKRSYGVASGTLATMRQIGMMFSMVTAMLMFTAYMGRVQITPEYYPLFLRSVKAAFVVFSGACFGGMVASLARGRMR